MAKGINLFFILLSSLVLVYQRNEGVSVGVLDPSVLSVDPAYRYANAAGTMRSSPGDRLLHGSVQNGFTGRLQDNSASAPRDLLQEIYRAEVGVRELIGKNDGPRIAEYLRYTDLGEGYAWCASFVSWVYGEAGYPEPRTAWSPSLFPSKRVIWERGRSRPGNGIASHPQSGIRPTRPPEPQSGALVKVRFIAKEWIPRGAVFAQTVPTQVKDRSFFPQKGDVFGIYFNSVKRIAHAGFVDEWGDKWVVTVEGNTNEAGSREGDGVYRKRRLISSIYQVANWL